MKKTRIKFFLSQKGSVVVEAAFVLPLFLIFIIGMIEFGRLYWVRSSLQLAITEAGRYAMINPTASNSQILTELNSTLYQLDPALFSVSITTETNNSINYKVITTTYNYTLLAAALINVDPITLTSTTRVPLLQ